MSLDDIWAEPIVEAFASISGPINPNAEVDHRFETMKPRSALFLSDTEDEDTGSAGRLPGQTPRTASSPTTSDNGALLPGPERAQLDEMFAGLDDDDDNDPFRDVAPAVDIESLKCQADARVAAASKSTLPRTSSTSLGDATRDKDNGDKCKKTKRVIPKLDAERLLGLDGFPRLLKEYKSFKITGKGHETGDLARLFRMYHAWSHKMYPKFQFRDTVDRVERLCRSRRMAVNLKVWRDEAYGVTRSVEHQVSQDDDDDVNSEHVNENEGVNRDQSVQGPVSPSASTRPPTPVTRPGSAASSAPSDPSSTTNVDDDMDIDALLREEEEIMREMNAAKNGASSSYKPSNVENDENASWTEATVIPMAILDMTMQPRLTGPTSRGEAEDEELWNMIDEIENQPPAPDEYADIKKADHMTTGFAPASPSAIREQPTIGADWVDMYE